MSEYKFLLFFFLFDKSEAPAPSLGNWEEFWNENKYVNSGLGESTDHDFVVAFPTEPQPKVRPDFCLCLNWDFPTLLQLLSFRFSTIKNQGKKYFHYVPAECLGDAREGLSYEELWMQMSFICVLSLNLIEWDHFWGFFSSIFVAGRTAATSWRWGASAGLSSGPPRPGGRRRDSSEG